MCKVTNRDDSLTRPQSMNILPGIPWPLIQLEYPRAYDLVVDLNVYAVGAGAEGAGGATAGEAFPHSVTFPLRRCRSDQNGIYL